MAEAVYLLCAAMSFICAVMLLNGYLKNRTSLLLWAALCFGFVAGNNMILFVDLALFPSLDIQGPLWRNLLSATGGSLLLFGLIWELT